MSDASFATSSVLQPETDPLFFVSLFKVASFPSDEGEDSEEEQSTHIPASDDGSDYDPENVSTSDMEAQEFVPT